MKSFRICLIALAILSANVKQSRTRKFELILSLKEYFKSKFILLVNDEDSVEATKMYYKQEKIPFVGIIDLKRNFKSPVTPFRNSLLIIDSQEKFLKQLSHMQDLNANVMSSVIWVVFVIQDVREKIRNARIPFDCLFLMVREERRNFGYDIFEIYEIGENKPKIVSPFGSWENGILKLQEKNSYYSRTDLQGSHFNVTESIFSEKKKEHEELWHRFSEKMNFSINWIANTSIGMLYPNRTKTGVFKMLEEHSIDGTPGAYAVLNPRLDEFDFIWPTVLADTKIYVAIDYRLNWTSFLAPFEWKVWLTIIMWILLISIVINLMEWLKGSHSICKEYSLLNTLRAVFYQGGKIQGSSVSYYISYLLPYILAMVIVQHYAGALHSFLTVKKSDIPFNDLEGVVKDGKYQVAALNASFAWFYIQTDNGTEAETIRNKLLLPPEKQPSNNTSGFKLLCRHRRVFLAVTLGFRIKENCQIQELSEAVFRHSLGLMVWKGFPYKDSMTKVELLKLGIMQICWCQQNLRISIYFGPPKMKRLQFAGLFKWKEPNIIDNNKNLGDYEPLSLRSIFPIFLFLGGLTCLSVLILLCEIMILRIKKNL